MNYPQTLKHTLLSALLLAPCAWSYRVGVLQDAVDPNRDTVHLFVSGYSHGVGDQFVAAAVTRALKYQKLYPGEKSVLIKNSEAGTWSNRLRILSDQPQTLLEGDLLVRLLGQYQHIASIDFYGHSSPVTGFGLEPDRPTTRLRVAPEWDPTALQTKNLAMLTSHFTPNAYVTINGCNSGYLLGPKLSNIWKVPVQAALTGTDFQEFHANGNYYFNNPGEYPSGGWSAENCEGGGCSRMKPVNGVYSGSWGHLEAGLSFYKTFCNYDASADSCARIMAKILQAFPSTKDLTSQSSRSDFEEVLVDFLCPISPTSNVRGQCAQTLRASTLDGNEVYGSLGDRTLECDLKGCHTKINCRYDQNHNAIPGSCSLSAPPNGSPKTTIREYKLYLRGFDLN